MILMVYTSQDMRQVLEWVLEEMQQVIQITLLTKKKDEVLEGKLETALLKNDYIFSLTSEYANSDHSINRVYEIRLEDFTHAK